MFVVASASRTKWPIVGAFEIAQPRHAGGEMPAGRREDSRLADLAAELAAKSVLPGELGQSQRGNEAAALRQAQIEQVARRPSTVRLGVEAAAQRFVEHDRRLTCRRTSARTATSACGTGCSNGADAERLQGTNALDGLGRRPGLIGIDAQVDLAAHPSDE